jgi:hypothetical protein
MDFIEEEVFGGFIRFTDRQHQEFSSFVRPECWSGYKFISWFLKKMLDGNHLQYILLTASKVEKNEQ